MEIRWAVRDEMGFGCLMCGRIVTKDETLEAAAALELLETHNPKSVATTKLGPTMTPSPLPTEN